MTRLQKRLRADALSAFREALRSIDPAKLIEKRVRLDGESLRIVKEEINLTEIERILVVAIGKAAARMVEGLEKIFGRRIDKGAVLSNSFPIAIPAKYRTYECTHPISSNQNVTASEHVLRLAEDAGEKDLVVCLVSGGGSAIFARPAGDITLTDKSEAIRLLMLAGASIHELNTVRKHLSSVKGGQLLRAASPARVLSLMLSDVPGDDPTVIASGPTTPDPSTYADAWSVIERFSLQDKLSEAVLHHLHQGLNGILGETPKPGSDDVGPHMNSVIGSNRDMLAALEEELRIRGYWTITELDPFVGEARERGGEVASIAKGLVGSLPASSRPYALISGGETTVRVTGDGLGGRNTELALAAAIELQGAESCLILAAGTDGIDGPTDAAGAVVDGFTTLRACEVDLDPVTFLENNDSYRFFKPLGDLITTGPTGTNLMDVVVVLIGEAES